MSTIFKKVVSSAILFFLVSQSSYAQLDCPSPLGLFDGYPKQHITLGIGPTFLYGDIASNNQVGFALQGKYDYKIAKGLLLGGELQIGKLKAKGDSTDLNDPNKARFVDNFYKSISMNFTVHPFHFFTEDVWGRNLSIKDKLLQGFYVGVGLGLVFNDYKDILRISGNEGTGKETQIEVDIDPFDPSIGQEILSSYKKKSISFIAPVINTGIVFPLSKTYNTKSPIWSLVANAQFSFSNDDDLDGYDPNLSVNTKNDMYSFYTLGVRYSF